MNIAPLGSHLRTPSASVALLALALMPAISFAGPYPLSKAAALTEADLQVIAQLLDVNYQRFDVEIDEDFCIRVWVEVSAKGQNDVQPHGGVCSRAGPHRLIVALRSIENDSVVVHVAARHHATGMGGGTDTTPISVPSGGWAVFETRGPDGEPPTLVHGERTLIAEYEYGRPADRVRIRVDAELLPNPIAITSSGALPKSVGERD